MKGRLAVSGFVAVCCAIVTWVSIARCYRPPDVQALNRDLPSAFQRLASLHTPLGPPREGEWLDRHSEPGQTYRQYVAGHPVRPTASRRTIYVFPLGEFSNAQRQIVELTTEYLAAYFGLPVRLGDDLPLDLIPADARRLHPEQGAQLLTTYVLDEVLRRRMPDDAVAAIALTSSDLWPGEGWNFVFGQASLRDRVGVWSMARFGDPEESAASYRQCLQRTLKTATHETGHMLSMLHCIHYECNMCGSNHLEESDSRPLWLCPNCLAKLCYCTDVDPESRYADLARFAREHGLADEAAFFSASLDRLRGE